MHSTRTRHLLLLCAMSLALSMLTRLDAARAETPAATAPYAAHEWGLIRYTPDSAEVATSSTGAAPPATPPTVTPPTVTPTRPPRPDGRTVRKPLIYLHPLTGYDPATTIDVTITLRAGTLREVWPTPGHGAQPAPAASHTWSGVQITPATACGGSLAPAHDAPACASLTDGGVCEAWELREYLGDVSSCLKVEDRFTPVLLYNGYLEEAAPVALMTTDQGWVRNTSPFAVGPLLVAHNDALHRVERLEAGAALALGPDTALLTSAGQTISALAREHVQVMLTSAQLTSAEAQDFLRAWTTLLAEPQETWTVFGFYSPQAIEAMFPLTLSPAPQHLRRVLAFTLEAR